MVIDIREVASRKDLKTFIYLPEKIHGGHANWVHPIYMDDWKFFDRKKNKAFGYCDTTLLVAWKDGPPAGRVMGIINHRFNEHRNERTSITRRFRCSPGHRTTSLAPQLASRVEALADGRTRFGRGRRRDWQRHATGFWWSAALMSFHQCWQNCLHTEGSRPLKSVFLVWFDLQPSTPCVRLLDNFRLANNASMPHSAVLETYL